MQRQMKGRLKKCEEFRATHSMPSAKEKGKTFQLDNKSRVEVAKIKIDGCVFNSTDGIKCDYLFEVPSKEKLFYVELKGSDAIHAIRQVHSTILQTKDQYKGWKYAARIVIGNGVPASVSSRKEYEELYVLVNKDLKINHDRLHREIL